MGEDYLTKNELERYDIIIKNYENEKTGIKVPNELSYLNKIYESLFDSLRTNRNLTNEKISLILRMHDLYEKKGVTKWANKKTTLKRLLHTSGKIFKEKK